MHTRTTIVALSCCLFLLFSCGAPKPEVSYDVVVIGGGAGGTAAGIQAARSGAQTLIVEETPWLGGMLTAAGVSATDGNHWMAAGIWGEFRQALRDHYRGPGNLMTGWVSLTQFEPHIGADIFKKMAEAEKKLSVWHGATLEKLKKTKDGWVLTIKKGQEKHIVAARILIDGTELGDLAALAGADYNLGMDARSDTGEAMAPEQANDIVQDLTYTAILKDYGPGADHTLPKPEGYNPALFRCACTTPDCTDEKAHPCDVMLNYAKLPNNKYLINWPKNGNDYYVNLVEMNPKERMEALNKAKAHTLAFVYYIQTELGYKNMGLADDEYKSPDKLPYMAYHREGRRIKGITRLTINHILHPFEQAAPLFRTGIATGDYPIDHHHGKNTGAPAIEFPPIPSFNIPAGCLIPHTVDDLIIADKAVSVTNIVNGASRLQPVVLQMGQSAGFLAAIAVKKQITPRYVAIREWQDSLLANRCYIMPYYDTRPESAYFVAAQRIGATGILQGKGEPFQWANRTWFYPDTTLMNLELLSGLQSVSPGFYAEVRLQPQLLTLQEAIGMIGAFSERLQSKGAAIPTQNFGTLEQRLEWAKARWSEWGLTNYQPERLITRAELAMLLDQWLDIFHALPVGWEGKFPY